jgi:hypothetical protein
MTDMSVSFLSLRSDDRHGGPPPFLRSPCAFSRPGPGAAKSTLPITPRHPGQGEAILRSSETYLCRVGAIVDRALQTTPQGSLGITAA